MGALMRENAEGIETPYAEEHANLIIDMQDILEALGQSALTIKIDCGGRGGIDVHLGDHGPNNAGDLPLTTCAAYLVDPKCPAHGFT